MNLRRMSYILLCGEKNQFLTSLPTIQEKLVDVLKNTSAPVVQAEVYLCVRVLMCRLSQHNLDSFWPVILSEMVDITSYLILRVRLIVQLTASVVGANDDRSPLGWFRSIVTDSLSMQIHRPPPCPSNRGVSNVNSISLYLHLQLSRATRHQWIFVTDTIDAVYRPDEIALEAMLDQLSEIAGGLPAPQVSISVLIYS